MRKDKPSKNYTDYWAVETAAGRIGLVCCWSCGAVVLVGDKDKAWHLVHDAWHDDLRRREPPDPVLG